MGERRDNPYELMRYGISKALARATDPLGNIRRGLRTGNPLHGSRRPYWRLVAGQRVRATTRARVPF